MSNKNQHFVSQAYLRWFGIPRTDGDPRAINLFAIRAQKVIQDASIKGQCARDYFYGRDEPVEALLQFFEGRYGSAMAKLNRGEPQTGGIKTLMRFLFLQYVRTPFQLKERLRLIEEFGSLEIAGRRVREKMPAPDRVREIQQQLHIFAEHHSLFDDLVPALLVNRTKVPFITSDNPAILMNRLHSQRYGDPTAGIISAGAIALMPLTPRIALLAYDGDVYARVGVESVLEIDRNSDVDRINELQVIRASEAIFFQSKTDETYVKSLFTRFASGRKLEWSITWVGIRDGEDERFERYRTAKPEDQNSLEPRLQSMAPILPAPSTWPSFLRFKLRPTAWTNGSVVGYVREFHRGRGLGMYKVDLPKRIPRNHSPLYRDVIYQRKKGERPRPKVQRDA